MARQKEETDVLGTEVEKVKAEDIEQHFDDKKVYKVKILKDHKSGLKEGEEQEVSGSVANVLLFKGLITKDISLVK